MNACMMTCLAFGKGTGHMHISERCSRACLCCYLQSLIALCALLASLHALHAVNRCALLLQANSSGSCCSPCSPSPTSTSSVSSPSCCCLVELLCFCPIKDAPCFHSLSKSAPPACNGCLLVIRMPASPSHTVISTIC